MYIIPPPPPSRASLSSLLCGSLLLLLFTLPVGFVTAATTPTPTGVSQALAARTNRSFVYSAVLLPSRESHGCNHSDNNGNDSGTTPRPSFALPARARHLSLYTEAHQRLAVAMLSVLQEQMASWAARGQSTEEISREDPLSSSSSSSPSAPLSSPIALLRAAIASDCSCHHRRVSPLCCLLYWVTDAYPVGLAGKDIESSPMLFWNGQSTVNGYYTNFSLHGPGHATGAAIGHEEDEEEAHFTGNVLVAVGAGGGWRFVNEQDCAGAVVLVETEQALPSHESEAVLAEQQHLHAQSLTGEGSDWQQAIDEDLGSSSAGREAAVAAKGEQYDGTANASLNFMGYIPAVVVCVVLLLLLPGILLCLYELSHKPRQKRSAAYQERIPDTFDSPDTSCSVGMVRHDSRPGARPCPSGEDNPTPEAQKGPPPPPPPQEARQSSSRRSSLVHRRPSQPTVTLERLPDGHMFRENNFCRDNDSDDSVDSNDSDDSAKKTEGMVGGEWSDALLPPPSQSPTAGASASASVATEVTVATAAAAAAGDPANEDAVVRTSGDSSASYHLELDEDDVLPASALVMPLSLRSDRGGGGAAAAPIALAAPTASRASMPHMAEVGSHPTAPVGTTRALNQYRGRAEEEDEEEDNYPPARYLHKPASDGAANGSTADNGRYASSILRRGSSFKRTGSSVGGDRRPSLGSRRPSVSFHLDSSTPQPHSRPLLHPQLQQQQQ